MAFYRSTIVLFPLLFLFAQDEPCIPECPCGPRPHHIDVRHLEYQGLGFNQGYTSFDLFLANPEPWRENNIFFLDVRAHVFNDGKPAANAGFGWRYLFDSRCDAFGINTYYDYRKTKRKNYNQFGIGLEYLTPQWTFRANGYLPFGARVTRPFDLDFAGFTGNNFFVSRKHEFSMAGVDAEVGWHFSHSENFDFFAGAGPYYFTGHLGKAAIGGKVRVEARLTPYVTLEVGDSYDAVFHNRFHAEVTFTFPFGPRTRARAEGTCCSCDDQIALQQWIHDAPNRNEIIVVDTQKKKSLGLDPVTGLPYFFAFVNNTSSSNGTFESPFSSFATTVSNPGDTIYVFPGDGTTTGMASGIVLKDNQRFLGSGVSHQFMTTVGAVTIPALTTASPKITNGAAVVTLALNNEVSGFEIMAGNPGISGIWGSGSVTANINRNFLNTPVGIGIDLHPSNCQANLLIDENHLFLVVAPAMDAIVCPYVNSTGTVVVQNTIIDSSNVVAAAPPVARGINMNHSGTTNVTVGIFNNKFIGVEADSVYVNALGPGATTVHTSVINNTLYGRSYNAGPIVAVALANLETENDSTHISIVQNNAFFGYPVSSIMFNCYVQAAASSTPQSRTETTIVGNSFYGGPEGIVVTGEFGGSGSIQTQIRENNVQFTGITNGALGGGISVAALGTGSINGEISANLVNDSGSQAQNFGYGIHVVSSTATCAVNITKNTVTNCFFGGILIEPSAGTIITNITDNFIAHNAKQETTSGPLAGIAINVNTGTCIAHVINNTCTDNPLGDFIAIAAGAASRICLQLEGNRADIGYVFDADPSMGQGLIQLQPPINNTGGFMIRGGITSVPIGTCN